MVFCGLRRLTGSITDLDNQLKINNQKVKEFSEKFYARIHTIKEQQKPFEYNAKQKRLFHRTFSGLQVAKHREQITIFWTLTTKYEKDQKQTALLRAEEELNSHFVIWKKRICRYVQRKWFDQWFKQNYPNTNLKTVEGRRLYKNAKNHLYRARGPKKYYNNQGIECPPPKYCFKKWYDKFQYKMCYIKVRTTEGGGVIHGILRKDSNVPMLDFNFLQNAWKEIHHNSHRIEIHEIKDRHEGLAGAKDTAFYLCGNYFNQQPVVRQSSSYNWIFQGAAATWVRGRTIHGIKKHDITYIPWTSEETFDGIDQTVKGTYIHKETRILLKRPGMIAYFMNTRKSLRKDSGYENALFFWLQLTRHPHTQTRQIKLKTFF